MRPKKPKAIGGKIVRTCIASLKRLDYPKQNTEISHIICAISGGSDSLALMALAQHYLGRHVQVQFVVAHVDHNWSGTSNAVAAKVAERARAWGVPSHVLSIARPEKGDSWEAAARRDRYAALNALAEQYELKSQRQVRIWTAHQADDVVETLLWRMLSGAPEGAWGGIAARWGRVERPLLSLWRSDIEQFLAEEGILDAERDAFNDDLRFLRARLRHEVFPVLERNFPRFKNHLFDIAHSRLILSTTGIVSYPRRGKGLGSADEIFSQDSRSLVGPDSTDGLVVQGRRSRRPAAKRT